MSEDSRVGRKLEVRKVGKVKFGRQYELGGNNGVMWINKETKGRESQVEGRKKRRNNG